MISDSLRTLQRAFAVTVLSTAAHMALAGAVITTGITSIGVNDSGELNFLGSGPGGDRVYGLYRTDVGDAISPGCFCEGWGVSLTDGLGSTFSSFANQSAGFGGIGADNLFGSTASTATSVVNMLDLPVSVRHAYGPSLVADVFQAQVTITNHGTSDLLNLTYRRAMDWDVPPTEFNEYVTHIGVSANLVSKGGNVLYASNDGFASSDPQQSANAIDLSTVNTDFNANGPNDHGSVFDFAFGTLSAGQSRVFNIYYGSAPNKASAIAKLNTLGANVMSLGQSTLGGTGGSDGPDGPEGPVLTSAIAEVSDEVPGEVPVEEGGGELPPSDPARPNDDGATFLFGFGGVGGVELGGSEAVPILPFTPAPGTFTFDAPVTRRWYDPPFATGFKIELADGEFISVMAPSTVSDLKVYGPDGTTLLDDDFDAGETLVFGEDVHVFYIRGGLFDLGKDAPLPLFLDFKGAPTSMTWTAEGVTPVPEASTTAMGLAALGVILGLRWRRRQA
jgi:hypothetical protein